MGKDYADFLDDLPEEELLEYFPEKLPAMEDRLAAKRIEKNVLRGVQVEEKCRWNGKRIAAAVCCFLLIGAVGHEPILAAFQRVFHVLPGVGVYINDNEEEILEVRLLNPVQEKDGVREDYDSIKDTLFGTSELEAERLRLQEEMNVVAELIEQCVAENARVALDQTEYQKKYDGLAGRFNRAKARLSEVSQAITERQAKREKIGRFVSCLEQMDGPLTAFNEDDWYSLVDYATVYSREDIRFTFKNGMEIKA